MRESGGSKSAERADSKVYSFGIEKILEAAQKETPEAKLPSNTGLRKKAAMGLANTAAHAARARALDPGYETNIKIRSTEEITLDGIATKAHGFHAATTENTPRSVEIFKLDFSKDEVSELTAFLEAQGVITNGRIMEERDDPTSYGRRELAFVRATITENKTFDDVLAALDQIRPADEEGLGGVDYVTATPDSGMNSGETTAA